MGVQSSQQTNSLASKLKLHQQIEDPIFGPVEIFRSAEPPYDYIMKYKRRFITKDATYDSFAEHLNRLQSLQHKILSKIHFVSEDKETYSCTKTPTICCYINYYNFTLRKAIDRKRLGNSCFNEADVWFLILSLVELAKYLRQQGVALGEYTSDRIYLAPDGSIRLYLLNIMSDNQHNPYYQILADQEQINNYLFSPEQLYYFSKDEYSIKFDVYKSDVFMMSASKADKFYNLNNKTISIHRIKQELLSLKNFLNRMLVENPNQRPDFDSLLQYIKVMENSGFNVIRQSNGIKLTQTDSVANKRKKALQNRRQQIEQEESAMSLLTLNPPSTQSSDKFRSTEGFRKTLGFPLENQPRALSIKTRNMTPLRRNHEKASTLYNKATKYSFMDDPVQLPKRRFQ